MVCKKQNITGVSLSVELCTFAYILLQDLVSHLESHMTRAQWVWVCSEPEKSAVGLLRTREFCSEPEKSAVGLLRTREECSGSAQNQRRVQWVCSEPEKSSVGLLRTREERSGSAQNERIV